MVRLDRTGHFCFKTYNFESIKDSIYLFFSIKYKASSAYNCLTDTKNINAKYFLKHLLFFFKPMLNLYPFSMIKYGKIQPRMSWMQLDTNVSFL